MSEQRFVQLLAAVTTELRKQQGPIAPENFIRSVIERNPQFSAADIRRAIWHLESKSQLDFGSDWTIRRIEAVA